MRVMVSKKEHQRLSKVPSFGYCNHFRPKKAMTKLCLIVLGGFNIQNKSDMTIQIDGKANHP